MLELFKPLKVLNDRSNPVIFNELGQPFIGNKSLRPFVIFYDDTENQYYYVKARDAFNIHTKTYKEQCKGEILITQLVTQEGLFTKDSYVDCSQIFKIDADLLESLVDKEDRLYKATSRLPEEDILRILETIDECCNEIPPYLSIVEVTLDNKNRTVGKSLYLCPEKFEDVCYKIDIDYYSGDDIHNIEDLISTPDARFSFQKERYGTGIEFVEKFQQKYFYNEWLDTDYQEKYYKPFERQKEMEL